MKSWFLGIDTSNYKTSAALYCPDEQVWRNCGRLLEVPPGTLGLRQSDALFQHVRRLSQQVELTLDGLDGRIAAIGCSVRPRSLPDSYMPCFLVGQCAAECMGAALHVPVYPFSHQQGHLAAAALSAKRLDLLRQPFLAWHLSGGTTELLLVTPQDDQIITETILGGSADISAGQLIDRVGVALGMPFPAGPYVEQLALTSTSQERYAVKIRDLSVSFSGIQNQFERRLSENCPPADVCRFVLLTVADAILRTTRKARQQYPGLPVLISGGVSVCSLVQQTFAKEAHILFAQDGLGGDNGVGAAVLASMR